MTNRENEKKMTAASAEDTTSADVHDEEAAPMDENGTHETVMVDEGSSAKEDTGEGESVGNGHVRKPVMAEEPAQEDGRDADDLGSMTTVVVNGTQMGFGERLSANGEYEQESMMGEKSASEVEEQHDEDLRFSMEAEKEISDTRVAVDDEGGATPEGCAQRTVVDEVKEPETKEPEMVSVQAEEDKVSRRKKPLRAIPKRYLHGCGHSTI